MANKDPDIHHTIKEAVQEITQVESKSEQKVDWAHEFYIKKIWP